MPTVSLTAVDVAEGNSGDEVFEFLVSSTTTSAAASIIHVDWMRLVMPRPLNR
jgi:hypothetical protein